jgi:hypothetical protein
VPVDSRFNPRGRTCRFYANGWMSRVDRRSRDFHRRPRDLYSTTRQVPTCVLGTTPLYSRPAARPARRLLHPQDGSCLSLYLVSVCERESCAVYTYSWMRCYRILKLPTPPSPLSSRRSVPSVPSPTVALSSTSSLTSAMRRYVCFACFFWSHN